MSVGRVIVVAPSAAEAESVKKALEGSGSEVEVIVTTSDSTPVIPAEAVADPDAHHLERLATLGTLAAGTAHEVNNLLTHLVATLYDASRLVAGLDEAGGTGEDAARARLRRDIDAALDTCHELRRLASGVTQYSSLGDSGAADTDIDSLLDEALTIAGPELATRARIDRAVAPDTPRVRVNRSKLCQVFVNLLTNAAHAIAARGDSPGVIRIEAGLDGDRARIDITDSGCGIAPSVASRVFEPFFTTKGEDAGTGLGLAVSRAIVVEHGGEVQLASEVGSGTTFSVFLPACAQI